MSNHYTYSVSWSAASQEYVGTCAEFRSLSHLDDNPASALQGIQALVADVVEDMKQSGEAVPTPLSDRRYSGQFMTRIPPLLHQRLTVEAAEAGVSLNRLVAFKLGTSPANPAAAAKTAPNQARPEKAS